MRSRPKVCGVLLLFYVCLGFCGCHGGEPKPLDRPRLAEGMATRDVTFWSAALGRQMPYRVFLPSMAPHDKKMPVVYLLHGNGGGLLDWSNNSDVAIYAMRGIILVMPEGNSSYDMNAAERPRDKYEDYLIHDLIPDVEMRFPARADRAGRAIVGVSMGGFGAVTLALRHPQLFVFAGAISPAIDVAERRFSWKRAGQWWEFRSIFGPMGSAERKSRDPFALAESVDPATMPYLYLTAGRQEPLLEPIQRFAARLHARGFAYRLRTEPGGHDWGEWNRQIPGCFDSLLVRISTS